MFAFCGGLGLGAYIIHRNRTNRVLARGFGGPMAGAKKAMNEIAYETVKTHGKRAVETGIDKGKKFYIEGKAKKWGASDKFFYYLAGIFTLGISFLFTSVWNYYMYISKLNEIEVDGNYGVPTKSVFQFFTQVYLRKVFLTCISFGFYTFLGADKEYESNWIDKNIEWYSTYNNYHNGNDDINLKESKHSGHGVKGEMVQLQQEMIYEDTNGDNYNTNDNINTACACHACGLSVQLGQTVDIYGHNEGAICNICMRNFKEYVYHCVGGKNDKHPSGYDLCPGCYQNINQ